MNLSVILCTHSTLGSTSLAFDLTQTVIDNMAKINVDALIVGCGFGGIYQLKRLRELGLKCIAIDAAGDAGVSVPITPQTAKRPLLL